MNELNVLQHGGGEEEAGNLVKSVEVRPAVKYPTVFRWTGTGEEVSIAGSFNSWRSKIPLVKRLATKYSCIFHFFLHAHR